MAYRVWCEDCDLDRVFKADEPPSRLVEYWGSVRKAKRDWDPHDAARGKRDNHHASEFRDYESGKRHRVHLEEVEDA